MKKYLAPLMAIGLLATCALASAGTAEDVAEWNRLNDQAEPQYDSPDPAKAAEAIAAAKRLLDFSVAHEKTLGPGYLALSWHNYGQVNLYAGNLAEARDAYEHALPLMESAYGPNSPHLAIALNSMAVLEHREKNYASGEKYARRALAIARAENPPTERVAEFSNSLAWMLFEQKKYPEAAGLYQSAIEVLEKSAAPDDPRLVMLRKQLAAAKAGQAPAGAGTEPAMSTAADAHAAFIEKIATLARERNTAELLACFDDATSSGQEAAIRDYLNTTVFKVFADTTRVAPYEEVTRAAAQDGREGLWHYGFVEDRKHKLRPFQLAIVDTSAGPRLLYLVAGKCAADRHPRMGPCK